MDVKKIMDKFESEFLKNENAKLPKELFLEGAGNSLADGKKLKDFSFKEISMIKGPDFEKFSKVDQELAMKIAEWWFDKFYATMKKPIVVPVEKNKVSKVVEVKPVTTDVKKDYEKNFVTKYTPKKTKQEEELDFHKALKDLPPMSLSDLKNRK